MDDVCTGILESLRTAGRIYADLVEVETRKRRLLLDGDLEGFKAATGETSSRLAEAAQVEEKRRGLVAGIAGSPDASFRDVEKLFPEEGRRALRAARGDLLTNLRRLRLLSTVNFTHIRSTLASIDVVLDRLRGAGDRPSYGGRRAAVRRAVAVNWKA
jgi:hypothetical protein